MNTQPAHQPRPIDPATYEAWRRDLARFVMAQGLRPILEHIPPDDWLDRYRAGDAPEDAALDEALNYRE
jgi:hypothetical protein